MKKLKFWKNLFGSKQSSKDSAKHNSTLERLRDMEELLQRKQTHLEGRIDEQVNLARKHGMKNKRAALNALKRKKRLETELTRIDGTLTTIETQREALEAAKNNVQILGAMKDAANVLKDAQKHVSVDKVLDIMDDVNEQQDYAREVADALSNPLGASSMIDDSELEKELEQLEQEDLDRALLEVEPTSEITSDTVGNQPGDLSTTSAERDETPSGKKTQKVVDPDEEELKELEAWSAS